MPLGKRFSIFVPRDQVARRVRLSRRTEFHLEALEDRQLLASDLHTLFADGSAILQSAASVSPFESGSFLPSALVERATQHAYVPGQLIVARTTQNGAARGNQSVAEASWSSLTGVRGTTQMSALLTHQTTTGESLEIVQLDVGAGTDLVTAMKFMEGQASVLWSSPNYLYEGTDARDLIPNDPRYTGSPGQYHHPLMKNNLAWDVTLGSPSVVIGVTDNGVDRAHQDLSANIWTNPGEIAGDGIDNDSNGRIDDINGWDFISNDNNPNPNNGNDHGTHVAGIAAGRTNNGVGIAGTAGGSKIMPLKFYDDSNPGAWTSAVILASMRYGVDNGASIITTSYNIDGFAGDPTVTSALQYIHDNGRLHFNSAGNNSSLNPPRQIFEQTLLVASTNETDRKSDFSNYGTGVDIASPGSNILSTTPNNTYSVFSGTSMATPNAAGVAALIWSAHPDYTRDQVAAQLLATADNIDGLNPAFAGLLGTGRVNSFRGVTETLAAPRVKSLLGLPATSAPISAGISSFSVSYNQVMNGASVLNGANYELRNAGTDGIFDTVDDQLLTITSTNSQYLVGTNQLNFSIGGGALGYGRYRLSILSGGVANAFGTALDGDGDGAAGGSFQHTFSIALAEFQRVDALGGLVSVSRGNTGSLGALAEIDSAPFFAEVGEKVSAVITPVSPTVILSARIPGVSGLFTAPGPGQPVTIPTSIVTATGSLDLEISGSGISTYTFSIVKNAEISGLVEDTSVIALEASRLSLGSSRFGALATSSGSIGGAFFNQYNNVGLFVDISATGTAMGLTDDSEANITTTVGNALLPAGTVRVGNNGVIFAGSSGDVPVTNGTLPSTSYPTSALSPFWDDIDADTGNVYWREQLVGGINTLIVQWNNRPHYSNVGSATFQLQLFASGPVAARFVYPDVDFGNAAYNFGVSATIGFQTTTTAGMQFSKDTASIANGDVIDIAFGNPSVDVDEYSLDLTPYVGKSIDIALSGTGSQGFAPDLLQLLDPSDSVVATGTTSPFGINVTNYDQGIVGYHVTAGGVYKVRVSAGHNGEYSLVVTEDLVLETEPNSAVPLRTLDGVGGALGFLQLTGTDVYALSLSAGQTIAVRTSTPFDDAGNLPKNDLDPAIAVLDSANLVVASDSNSEDGKNASLTYTAIASGVFTVRVSVEAGIGEYVLHVTDGSSIDGDFNDDGFYNCDDVNALTGAIATSGSVSLYDLTGDLLLNTDDLNAWLLEAGENNLGAGRSYVLGDADLDSVVDGSDFGIWNAHKFTTNTNWCDGNFDADSVVDGVDFGIWNAHKFTSADSTGRVAGVIPVAAPAAKVVDAAFAETVRVIESPRLEQSDLDTSYRSAVIQVPRQVVESASSMARQVKRAAREVLFASLDDR